MSQLDTEIDEMCTELNIPGPLQFLTKVMAGQDPRHNSRVYELLLELEAKYGEGEVPDEWDWIELASLIKEKYKYSPVQLSESHAAAKQIMEYTHAKKKQTEASSQVKSGEEIKPLTHREINRFKMKFNHEY